MFTILLCRATLRLSHIDVSAYWRCSRYGTADSARLYVGIQPAADVVLITLAYFSYYQLYCKDNLYPRNIERNASQFFHTFPKVKKPQRNYPHTAYLTII